MKQALRLPLTRRKASSCCLLLILSTSDPISRHTRRYLPLCSRRKLHPTKSVEAAESAHRSRQLPPTQRSRLSVGLSRQRRSSSTPFAHCATCRLGAPAARPSLAHRAARWQACARCCTQTHPTPWKMLLASCATCSFQTRRAGPVSQWTPRSWPRCWCPSSTWATIWRACAPRPSLLRLWPTPQRRRAAARLCLGARPTCCSWGSFGAVVPSPEKHARRPRSPL